jgi:hypothetical protein
MPAQQRTHRALSNFCGTDVVRAAERDAKILQNEAPKAAASEFSQSGRRSKTNDGLKLTTV